MTDEHETEVPERTVDPEFAAIGRLVRLLDENNESALSRGDIAGLRREDGARSPTFYRVAGQALGDVLDPLHEPLLSVVERRWALAVHLLARTAGLHGFGAPRLGEALANAQLSEARFIRLLRAEDGAIEAAARAAIAPLVQHATVFHPGDLVQLVLTSGSEDHPGYAARREKIRREVARHYYRALAKHEQPSA